VPRADTVALLAGALGLEGDVRAGFEHAAAAARIKREEDQSPPLVPVPVTIHPASTPAKQAQHTRLGRRLLKVAAVPAVPVAFLLALLVARWAPVGRSQLTASGHPLAPTHLHLTAIWKPPALEPFTLREPRSVALEPIALI
jgi:hypothetical protein